LHLKLNENSKKYYYWLIVILVFILYANSTNNEYSLDDNIVVDRNDGIVEKGFKAIPRIFKSRYAIDPKQSYDYRPITTISFAIEKQFFKRLPKSQTSKEKERNDKLTQANVSHFFNVLLYALTCLVLFQLLRLLFNEYNVLLSLVITIIFIVHPIHTEVVANIKCRDELLMFLFMLLSIKSFIQFEQVKKHKYLIFAIIFTLLSILSKKNGFAILGMVPVIFYFKRFNWKRILVFLGSFIVVFILFKFIKKGVMSSQSVRDFKFHENPLLANGSTFIERLSLGLYCSLFYLKMLVFPFKMSYYYGYSAIPIVTWKMWQVWVSLLIYVPLTVYGFVAFFKRKVVGLGIVLWLGIMLSVINVVMPMVGIVADRFTYSLSFGFSIVVGYLLLKAFKIDLKADQLKIKLPQTFVVVMSIIILVYSGRTIARNPDWHDYLHTYQTDIDNVPNSAKAHSLIANMLYTQVVNDRANPENAKKIEDILYHYTRAVEIDSSYLTCLNNLASSYIELTGDYEKGIYYSSRALMFDPDYVEANFNLATAYSRSNQPDSAFKYYVLSIEKGPDNLANYSMFNNFLIKNNKINEGINALIKIAKESDKPKFIYTNIGNLYSNDPSKINMSILYFEKAYKEDTTDNILKNHLDNLYAKFGRPVVAN